MFRKESDLLQSLLDVLTDNRKKSCTECNIAPLTKAENDLIESYRDGDNFINLLKLKDSDVAAKLIELVDKKNHLESLGYGKLDLDDFAKKLVDEMMPLFNGEKAEITIKSPTETKTFTVNGEEQTEHKCSCNNDKCKCKHNQETPNREPQTNVTTETPIEHTTCENKAVVKDDRVILLRNAGGMNNPLFYNAVLYICNNILFRTCGVYSETDVHPVDVDAVILLPNAWGKIYDSMADHYANEMDKGFTVYVIDPETFQLVEMENSSELYTYSMTEIQESINDHGVRY